MDFPYLSAPQRDLMVGLVSTVETRLQSHLLPCTLPPEVQSYSNDTGTAHGSLHIRSGTNSSPVNFILGSWIHSQLPSGGALNIASFSAYLNPSTAAPSFLMELIQSSPSSLIFILDLPPRKDLVLNPDYLKTFYEDTQLDRQRRLLENIPEVRPYLSSSLYVRCASSPTAILVGVDTDASGGRMEEIVRENVGPIAMEVLGVWLDRCVCAESVVGEERPLLEKRDLMFRKKAIDVDLESSLPKLFGPDVAGRVIEAIREVSCKMK